MGSRRKIVKAETLLQTVRSYAVLEDAWQVVRRNGIAPSASQNSKSLVLAFEENASTNLRSIQGRIRPTYAFPKQKGVVLTKSGAQAGVPKKKRPIVVAPIENRIVHRAILDVLIEFVPKVREVINIETSVGGIEGVDTAIALVWRELTKGKMTHFVRSDIPAFFTNIDKKLVEKFIDDALDEKEFVDLFKKAIRTDLMNVDELSDGAELFPLGSKGVAQGSALSPLVGNIVLRDFDKKMNSQDIVCIRYIDDFLILGKNQSAANAAFKRACKMLSKLGLDAYNPATNPDKAESGAVEDGFDFLGCRIYPGLVQPARIKKRGALERIKKMLSDSKGEIQKFLKSNSYPLKREHTFPGVELEVANFVRGWSYAYRFCNDGNLFAAMDSEIDKLVDEFSRWVEVQIKGSSLKVRRRVYGIPRISDVPRVDLSSIKRKIL